MTDNLHQQLRDLILAGDEVAAVELLRQRKKLPLRIAREQLAVLAAELRDPEPQDAAYILTSLGGFVLMVVVGLSGFLFIATAKHLFDYGQSADWPTIIGEVTRSQRDNVAGASSVFGPSIEYRFTVDNITYESDVWGFPLVDAGYGSGLNAVLARYPLGASVQVHYDPEQPQHALLDTDMTGLWVRLLAFVIGLPVYLWYRGFARRVESRSRARMATR